MDHTHARALLIILTAVMLPISSWADESAVYQVELESQPLSDALKSFADQTGLQIMFFSELTDGVQTAKLVGGYTANAALDTLLGSSGLTYDYINDRAITVRASNAVSEDEGGDSDSKNSSPAPVLMAQNQTIPRSSLNPPANSDRTDDEPGEDAVRFEEIVVTGTNIRGAESPSPTLTFDREAIVRTGFATTRELIDSVPQIFGAGAGIDTGQAIRNDSNLNLGGGTGINLRGLGADSTLTLLNGKRLAPGGFGNFVDVSAIPVGAIERIDVVTDGASALYGADAVGGVVNFVLRTDFEGAETSARVNLPTRSGGGQEYVINQLLGASWTSGSAMISFEYAKLDNLVADDRDFSRAVISPTDITPEQDRYSLFASVGQDIAESVEVYATALYGTRDSFSRETTVFEPEPFSSDADIEQLAATAGLRIGITEEWLADISGTFTYTDSASVRSNVTAGVEDGRQSTKSDGWIVDAVADGLLFSLPGGEVRAAIGGQYRHETFDRASTFQLVPTDLDQDIYSIFGELNVPLVGANNARPGVQKLELAVSARYEDFSNFGGTTSPQFGLIWSPAADFTFRGTYGESFRAPLFLELDESRVGGFFLQLDDFAANGDFIFTPGVIVSGGNAGLDPEEAETWTAGFDWIPSFINGLVIQATYFAIDFAGRIDAAPLGFDVLVNPDFAGLIDRNPDRNFVDFLALQSDSFIIDADPADVEVLFDGRELNLSSTKLEGVDAQFSYDQETDFGAYGFSGNVSYLFELEQQLTDTSPVQNLVGTIGSPARFRLRMGAYAEYGGLNIAAFVNFVDEYENDRADPIEPIDSWLTFDLRAAYTFENSDTDILNGLTLSINVQNLFDEDPPFVDDSALGNVQLGFDPENASPFGRIVGLQLLKRW